MHLPSEIAVPQRAVARGRSAATSSSGSSRSPTRLRGEPLELRGAHGARVDSLHDAAAVRRRRSSRRPSTFAAGDLVGGPARPRSRRWRSRAHEQAGVRREAGRCCAAAAAGSSSTGKMSRLQVVCTCRPHLDLPPVLVREATPEEREKALEPLQAPLRAHASSSPSARRWRSTVRRRWSRKPKDEIGAALAWRPFDGALHILALATDPMWQRAGLGGHLVAEAELLARRPEHSRVIVTITNDNIPALYFYQRRGYRMPAIVRDSLRVTAPRPEAPSVLPAFRFSTRFSSSRSHRRSSVPRLEL